MTNRTLGPAYRILTPRLCLRCWNPQDAVLLKDAVDASLEHLSPWMIWAQTETPLQDHIDRLRNVRSQFDLGQDFVYGIFSLEGDQVIGSTGLHTRVGNNAREIGYWIHVDHTGKGYATEAAAALTQVAFKVDGVDRVEIHCDPTNAASAAIPQKLGFIHEATLQRRLRWSEDVFNDSMIWSLFSDQFPESPSAQIEIQAFDAADREIRL